MASENSTEKQSNGEAEDITEEQYQLVLDASHELAKISVAMEHLSIAHNSRTITDGGSSSDLYNRRLLRQLVHRRQELRSMLLDLG